MARLPCLGLPSFPDGEWPVLPYSRNAGDSPVTRMYLFHEHIIDEGKYCGHQNQMQRWLLGATHCLTARHPGLRILPIHVRHASSCEFFKVSLPFRSQFRIRATYEMASYAIACASSHVASGTPLLPNLATEAMSLRPAQSHPGARSQAG